MERRNSVILFVIGVLVFTSVVAQDPHGTPGVDYPNYFTMPVTSFKCSDQKYNPGFYADLETKCQAFHFCYQDRMESFLCPTGTIFNQAVLTCDVWYKSNCSLAQIFYSVNAGPVMERAGKNLPMLLRLRNRSQSKSPVQTSTASALDKASMYETDNETPSEASSISKGGEIKDGTSNKSLASSFKNLANKNDEQILIDGHEEIGSEKDASEETDKFTNEVDEEMDANLVYDSVNDGYYKNYDQFDGESQNIEPESLEFKDFYDYREPHNEYKDDSRKSHLKGYINKQSLESSDLTNQQYPVFAKRSSHARVRRKPIYVGDQPAISAEMAETRNLDYISNSGPREGKEMDPTSESVEAETPSSTPFPRPTAIPHHQRNIPTATPMSSGAFEAAILSELYYPLEDSDPFAEEGAEVFTSYPQSDQAFSQSEETYNQSHDIQSDDTIYIQNDMEPETPSPTPFPRPTAIPHDQRNIPTATPMSSEAFGEAILSELYYPLEDSNPFAEGGADDFTSYPQSDQAFSQSEETYNQSPYIQSDGTIYIQSDMEPESYSPYNSQYEDVIVQKSTEADGDTEDTFVVIPDEYDENVGDFEMPDYPEETAYRTKILADQSSASGYDEYNSYRQSSNVAYPQYYEQDNYPEQTAQMYENYMPNERYAYESNYEVQSQPMHYESSDFDSEEMYAQSEFYPYAETRLGVTERPLALPVTEDGPDNFSNEFEVAADSEQDGIDVENKPGQSEDIYYEFDKTNKENETEISKEDEKMKLQVSLAEKSHKVNEKNSEVKLNSSNNEASVHSESSDIKSEQSEKFTKTDESAWSSNSFVTSQNDHIEPDNVKSSDESTNSMNILAGSNVKYASQQIPPVHESLASTNTYSSNMGGFDFSSDSRFLNNMGYSESVDFGPYGFGPNMGQQFSMMESMQNQAASPFSQRISQADQPKVSPLSAIQEKMRSMKQGKFGAFKKYMSSTSK